MALPWYDAYWLDIYQEARAFIARYERGRLADFEESFKVLAPPEGFKVQCHSQFFNADLVRECRTLIAGLSEAELEHHELFPFGRLVVHNHPRFNELQQSLIERVSVLCGEPVESSYNFLSLYNNLGVCKPHLDSPLAKWTLDVCIDQSEPWPIYISDPVMPPDPAELGDNWQEQVLSRHEFHAFEHEPGDALLFAGSHQWHYRQRIARSQASNYCHLIYSFCS